MTNPEQLHENLADIKEPAKPAGGLEIAKTPELEKLVDQANELAEAIQQDEPVKFEQVIALNKALDQLKIDIDGEIMTLEELRSMPDYKRNLKILRDMDNNDYSSIQRLVDLPAILARHLAKKHKGDIGLSVITLSVDSAKALAYHDGNINFGSLFFEMQTKEVQEALKDRKVPGGYIYSPLW